MTDAEKAAKNEAKATAATAARESKAAAVTAEKETRAVAKAAAKAEAKTEREKKAEARRAEKWLCKSGRVDGTFLALCLFGLIAVCVLSFLDPNSPFKAVFGSLTCWAVMFIGLLMAYLTVMQLWTLPPKEESAQKDGGEPQKLMEEVKAEGGRALLESNLAKTVVAGLSGVAAISVLKPLLDAGATGNAAMPDGTRVLLYISWFIFWFFFLLIWAARFNARNESRRVEQALRRRIHAADLRQEERQIARDSEIVYLDTFCAFIRGRNQQATSSLADLLDRTEKEHHRIVQRVISELQANVQAVLMRRLVDGTNGQTQGGTVRVSVSLLAEDGKSAVYLSSQAGSLREKFAEKSIAVLCLRTRTVRWIDLECTEPNSKDAGVELFDNVEYQRIRAEFGDHAPPAPFSLKDWLQHRSGNDYKAFIVIPTYLKRNRSRRVAALHISFGAASDMHLLFPQTKSLDRTSTDFSGQDQTFRSVAVEHAVLQQALLVLDDLVQGLQDRLVGEAGGA